MVKSNRHILVVDDSKAILIVMHAILNELEVPHITTCLSAEEALEKVKKAPRFFDAIFTDSQYARYGWHGAYSSLRRHEIPRCNCHNF